jgi:hypothetical protein
MMLARVVVLPGETHALSRSPAVIGDAVSAWLREILANEARGR